MSLKSFQSQRLVIHRLTVNRRPAPTKNRSNPVPSGSKAKSQRPSRRILNFTTSLRGKRNRSVSLIVLAETSRVNDRRRERSLVGCLAYRQLRS